MNPVLFRFPIFVTFVYFLGYLSPGENVQAHRKLMHLPGKLWQWLEFYTAVHRSKAHIHSNEGKKTQTTNSMSVVTPSMWNSILHPLVVVESNSWLLRTGMVRTQPKIV